MLQELSLQVTLDLIQIDAKNMYHIHFVFVINGKFADHLSLSTLSEEIAHPTVYNHLS